MESGDKSQGFLPQDADDGSNTPPHRADPPARAAPSSMSSNAYAGVSDGSRIDQPYKSEHYRDYPVSAAERKAMDEEAAAAEAYENETRRDHELDIQTQQQRMLSSSLTNSSSDNYVDDDEEREDDEEQGRRNELDPSRVDGGAAPLPIASSSSALSTGSNRIHIPRLSPLEIEHDPESEEFTYSFPWRSALVSFLLLLLGSGLLILGFVHLAQGKGSALAFVLVGVVLLIPGCYQTYQIYHAWKRTPGFSFSQLAAFEGR